MLKAVLTTLFLAYTLFGVPGAYSQAPVQNPATAATQQQQRPFRPLTPRGNRTPATAAPQSPQQAQPKPGIPAPVTAAPPQVQPQPQPVMPKKESVVELTDNKLSVDVSDADLGAVMNQIGAKLHVPVQVSGAVYGRKISTKFSGLDIERGLERLLTLAKENNYLIRYNETGAVSGIELYADNPAPTAVGQRTPGLMPSAGGAPTNPVFRRRYRRFTPPQQQQQPAQQQQAQPTVEQVGQ